MDYNILYNIKKNIIEFVEPSNIIDSIYFLEYKVPNLNDLQKIKNLKDNQFKQYKLNDELIKNIKIYISKLNYKIPLYDIYTNNIYLINRENLYLRINFNHYRFPNKNVISDLRKEYDKIKDIKTDDILEIRKKRKYELMFEFFDNFDIDILEDTFYRTIYKHSDELGKNIIFCKRPSFNKYIHNSKPYYSSIEIINMALNMGIDIDIKDKNLDLEKICNIVRKNDIDYKIISSHQKYIIDNDMMGLIQYYSVQGSYFVNNYLRNIVDYNYNNTFLDNIIIPMWNLCINSPEFDKDYIVYRFVKHDYYLESLNIGDIFYDEGFMSTTRNPFYKSEDYQFGFILIKIKIPKGQKGTGLCIENISHFPEEQEILFAPKTKFKLISRDSDIVYYHTDLNITSNVKTRYEFEWVGVEKPVIDKKKYNGITNIIDFIELTSTVSDNIYYKLDKFIQNNCDDLHRIICKIGDKTFLTTIEKYNSIGAYKNFYAIETNNGYSMYSIYKNYLLFLIEIGMINNVPEIHVNYYVKYNTLNKEEIFSTKDFIDFVASIGYYFGIDKIFIYPEYKPCITSKNKKDKEYNLSGNYCIDFYNYLKNNQKRFFMKDLNIIELKPLFSYYDLDLLKELDIDKIFSRVDDELYQLYIKFYKINFPDKKVSDYLIWIIENKCYLTETFIKKLEKIYKNNNPFRQDMYILNAMNYLYNKNITKIYGDSNFLIKERRQYYVPSNEYRIIRR